MYTPYQSVNYLSGINGSDRPASRTRGPAALGAFSPLPSNSFCKQRRPVPTMAVHRALLLPFTSSVAIIFANSLDSRLICDCKPMNSSTLDSLPFVHSNGDCRKVGTLSTTNRVCYPSGFPKQGLRPVSSARTCLISSDIQLRITRSWHGQKNIGKCCNDEHFQSQLIPSSRRGWG